jgi:hypothetical protein
VIGLSKPITKDVMIAEDMGNGLYDMSYHVYRYNRSNMSKKQRLILDEIEENGYTLYTIYEHYIKWNGERWRPAPEVLAVTNMKGIYDKDTDNDSMLPDNTVVLFWKSIQRAKRLTLYRMEKDKKKYLMPSITDILVHELAHVISDKHKHPDVKKSYDYLEEFYHNGNYNSKTEITTLWNKTTELFHGKDFIKIYNRLCKKYNIERRNIFY